MSDVKRTVLWSADTVQPNNTSITLNDSIDNYDEIIYYGSGTRTYSPCVMTEYPVISGQLNLGGPFFFGNWGATDGFVLCNGTQVFLSGTSGFVASSYYWGKNASNTAYAASLVTNRTNDVRPYMIVGVKYPVNYDRTLIWSSEHTAQLYETNIQLSEPVTHFKEIAVLGSGFENGGVGCRHASKNIYNTQPRVMGCDAWTYTPWKLAEKHNLLIGQEMRLSGNSGYIGSGYFMGMGNQTTAYAAGKWATDYQFSATAPYAIFGIDRKPVLNLNLINGEHGIISADTSSGCEYDYVNLKATPNEGWYFSGYSISGAQLTGNQFRFNNSDVTVEGGWTDQGYPITYLSDDHVHLTGDQIYIPGSEGITLDSGYDTYYRISGYDITGGSIVNGKLVPTGPCTIKAVEKVNYFTARGNFNLYGAGQYILNAGASNTAISYAHYTGGINVPTSYYNVSLTSTDRGNNSVKANGWNPASNISGYRFSGQTKASTYVERVNTRVQCSLQVGSTNFGNKYDVTFRNATNAINNTGTTTTIGKVRRYLTVADAGNSRHYMNDVTNTSTNTWTATGIAP